MNFRVCMKLEWNLNSSFKKLKKKIKENKPLKNMKNQTFKTMLLILLVIGTNITISAQAWQRIGKQFGNTPNSGTTFYSPALAFSTKSNVLYTAFINASSELVVMKSDNLSGNISKISWNQVGLFGSNISFAPSIVINPVTDEPYVAYVDGNDKYVVHKFNNKTNAWEQLGKIQINAIGHHLPLLVFKPNTEELFLTFIDGTNNNNVVVSKFDGTGTWNSVGNNTIGTATGNTNPYQPHYSCSLAFNPANNEPYIAFINNSSYLTIKRLAGDNNWYDYGMPGTVGKVTGITTSALAFNPINNSPYVVFSSDIPFYSYVKVVKAKAGPKTIDLSGSPVQTILWSEVKSNGTGLNNVSSTLAFVPGTDTPYVTGWNAAGGVFLVKKYTGSAWDYSGYIYCTGITGAVPSIGPSCGYNNEKQTPTLLFNTLTNKAFLSYAIFGKYEVRIEP